MSLIQRIKIILQDVKLHFQQNEYVHDDTSYFAFILSLLPLPGLQQFGQVVDRVAANKALRIRMNEIWDSIRSTNSQVEKIENELERIHEIGAAVKSSEQLNAEIRQLVESIINDLNADQKVKWILESENWSYQEILNSIVDADFAKIIATNNSTNMVGNTEVKATETHLHASNNSKNYFDKTKFSGKEGSVEMNSISTQGDIIIEGSSIRFGIGGTLIFGDNPNLVRGNCPFCGNHIEADKRKLVGYTQIKCPNPHCAKTFNFTIR